MIPDSRQILLLWYRPEQIKYKIHRYCFYRDNTELLITKYYHWTRIY